MKLAINGILDDSTLKFAQQLGVTDVVNGVGEVAEDKGYYGFLELSLLKTCVENAGLKWSVLEGMPPAWCDKIKLGLPGRDEQIENWCKTLRNMGAAGIPGLNPLPGAPTHPHLKSNFLSFETPPQPFHDGP